MSEWKRKAASLLSMASELILETTAGKKKKLERILDGLRSSRDIFRMFSYVYWLQSISYPSHRYTLSGSLQDCYVLAQHRAWAEIKWEDTLEIKGEIRSNVRLKFIEKQIVGSEKCETTLHSLQNWKRKNKYSVWSI